MPISRGRGYGRTSEAAATAIYGDVAARTAAALAACVAAGHNYQTGYACPACLLERIAS